MQILPWKFLMYKPQWRASPQNSCSNFENIIKNLNNGPQDFSSELTISVSQQAEEMGDVEGVYGQRKKNSFEMSETCRWMMEHDTQQ